MRSLEFKKKGVVNTPLTYWQIDKRYTIAIYQGGRGARPDLDFIVKHKEEGKRLRTPSHTHWIVDLIVKSQYDKGRVKSYVEDMIEMLDVPRPNLSELLISVVDNRMFQVTHGGLSGYIRYCNRYFIFQPNVYGDLAIPMALRVAKIPVRRDIYRPELRAIEDIEVMEEGAGAGTGAEAGVGADTGVSATERAEEYSALTI
jgi:hypothetical protein